MEHRAYDNYGNKIIQYKRVFLYLRRSSKPGSKKQIRSLEDQETDCLRMAEYLGLEIVETISEKQSARQPHIRPKFKYMLKELKLKNPKRRKADGIQPLKNEHLMRHTSTYRD